MDTILELPKRRTDLPSLVPAIDLGLLQSALDYIRPAVQADGGDIVLLAWTVERCVSKWSAPVVVAHCQ